MSKPTKGKKKADVHKGCRGHVDVLEQEAVGLLDNAKKLHDSREKQWLNYADNAEEEIDRLSEHNKKQYSRAQAISKEREALQKKNAKLEASQKTQVESLKLQVSQWKKKFTNEAKKTTKLEEKEKKLKAELEEARLETPTPTAAPTNRSSGGKSDNTISYIEKKQIDLQFLQEKQRIEAEKKERLENHKMGTKMNRMNQLQQTMNWATTSGAVGSTSGMFSATGMMNMMVRFFLSSDNVLFRTSTKDVLPVPCYWPHRVRISSYRITNTTTPSLSYIPLHSPFTVSK